MTFITRFRHELHELARIMKREPSTDLHDEPLAFWGALLVVVVAGLALATVLGLLFGCVPTIQAQPASANKYMAYVTNAARPLYLLDTFTVTNVISFRQCSITDTNVNPRGWLMESVPIYWVAKGYVIGTSTQPILTNFQYVGEFEAERKYK